MSYTVYVLEDNQKKLYKGMTTSLTRRLSEHARGKTKTTRSMSNLKLVYKERYDTFGQARERELYLKTAAGRRFLKKLLEY